MLVSKSTNSVTVGDVVALKLTSGEEIIGKFVARNTPDQEITISKPIMVQLQMVQPGQAAIAFAPFMMSREEDGDYVFNTSALVLAPAKVRDDIRSSYFKATTGLDIPTTGGPSAIIKP